MLAERVGPAPRSRTAAYARAGRQPRSRSKISVKFTADEEVRALNAD